MTEDLSSPLTFVFKYGFLPGWFIIGGVIVVAVFIDPEQYLISGGEPLPSWVAWFVLAMFVVGGLWAWQFARPLVRLGLGPDYVELWTLRARGKVSIHDIREVRRRPGTRGMVVEVEFRDRTPFGARVSFLANAPDAADRLETRVWATV